jgi:hypothetical protein
LRVEKTRLEELGIGVEDLPLLAESIHIVEHGPTVTSEPASSKSPISPTLYQSACSTPAQPTETNPVSLELYTLRNSSHMNWDMLSGLLHARTQILRIAQSSISPRR